MVGNFPETSGWKLLLLVGHFQKLLGSIEIFPETFGWKLSSNFWLKLFRNFWLETFQKLLVRNFYYWWKTSRNFLLETFTIGWKLPETLGKYWKLSRNFYWKLSRNLKTFGNFLKKLFICVDKHPNRIP